MQFHTYYKPSPSKRSDIMLNTTVCSIFDKGYRFGFNGKELDDEGEGMGGGGSTYDYGFRIYNPNIGKFLSMDPLTKSYPWYTPYQFAGNTPIQAIDLDGLEEYKIITFLSATDNCTYSEIQLVNANQPFKIMYYAANMIPNCEANDENGEPDGYNETFVSSTNTGFNSKNEYYNGLYLYNSYLNRRDKNGNQTGFISCATFKTPLTPPPPPPTPTPVNIPYNGTTLKLNSSVNVSEYSIGWVSMTPLVSAGGTDGKAAVSGELTKEGKKILKSFAKSINSMSSKPASVNLTVNSTVGTALTSAQQTYVTSCLQNVASNAAAYLKSKIKSGIKVTATPNLIKSDTTINNSTTAKIQ